MPTRKPLDELAASSSPVELVKDASVGLRGTIAEGLDNEATGAVSEDDTNLIKFHGIYQQDDRDMRDERVARKLEPAYSFMLRLRIPGGVMSARQWLQCDRVAHKLTKYHSLRLTNRQTIQFHGIPKPNLRSIVRSCDQVLLDSIAACGDVNRNVMCSSGPESSPVYRDVRQLASQISERLLPKTRAYHEIWLGEERLAGGEPEPDPLYGRHYLPRKFKIAIAVPPRNDTDIYANDVGFIAIVDDGRIAGYNVTAGGGMGMTFGDPRTYPRLGDVLGFCQAADAVEVAWHLATIQRDYGDRSDRKIARFKYTVDRLGLDFVRSEVENRTGKQLGDPRPFQFADGGDCLGWEESDGMHSLTLFVESGRINDWLNYPLKTALAEIAGLNCCEFKVTPNQNLTLAGIAAEDRERIEAVLKRREVMERQKGLSGIRRRAMACVALPTCPLAMSEAERYLPVLVSKLEMLLEEHGLREEDIVIRISGCPNGCARPHLAEIGLIGKSVGRYNLYLGAAFNGTRMNRLYKENLGEQEILDTMRPLIAQYGSGRSAGECFGDFVIRQGIV